MSITLTDQQWSGVKEADSWFKICQDAIDQHGYEVESKKWNEAKGAYDYSMRVIAPEQFDPCVFTGYAGSGKSTCVGAMIEHLGLTPDEVMYMAPTGKAAKVLTRKLKESGWPNAATTIHKAIYMPKTDKADAVNLRIVELEKHVTYVQSNGAEGSKSFDPKVVALDVNAAKQRIAELTIELGELMDREGPKFALKSAAEIPSDVKLFVVDEASMVGTMVKEDLESFGIPILAIGDPGQLPPVGDDWGFNMEQPDVFLTEIHRQAADNPIIQLATLARKNKEIKVGDYGDGVRVLKRRDDDVTYNMDRDAMILCGTNKKRWAITQGIRKELGLKQSAPAMDEPLLVVRNSRNYNGLVNGTLLRSTQDHGDLEKGRASFSLSVIDDDAGGWTAAFTVTQGVFEEHSMRAKGAHTAPDRAAFEANKKYEHVDWGHAITVHKSQGSEFDDVALHDESPVFRQDASRWLYTGITRASKELTILV